MDLEVIVNVQQASSNIMNLVKQLQDKELAAWLADTSNGIHKIVYTRKDVSLGYSMCVAFESASRFYKNLLDSRGLADREEILEKLALSVYFFALQLGTIKFDNRIIDTERFLDNVDLEDWKKVDKAILQDYDYRMCLEIIKEGMEFGKSGYIPILGINSSTLLYSSTGGKL